MIIVYLILFVAFFITVMFLIRSLYIKFKNRFILIKASEKVNDGYLIFYSNGKITNFNKAFLDNFNFSEKNLKNKNVYEVFDVKEDGNKFFEKILNACKKVKESNEIQKFEIKKDEKVFKIEVKSIVSNDISVRYAIICKDVTHSYEMIEELRKKQDLMINREKFATLGQLISGVVHSLKSPIFAISGELEVVNNLIKEYEESVEDKSVTIEDHYEIAKDITQLLDKMKIEVENISDSIMAIKGQVITLNGGDKNNSFTINELIKFINLLMKNTLKEYLIILQFTVKVPDDFEIKGNLNSLVQVINNLIMNSIESYHGKTNQIIRIIINKKEDKLEISVIDTGNGIPKRIQNKLFKEIITKSGVDKVGLGLFLAYSSIKADFNGDIKFTSKLKKGSTFTILLPI